MHPWQDILSSPLSLCKHSLTTEIMIMFCGFGVISSSFVYLWQMYRLTVRSTKDSVARTICSLLESQFWWWKQSTSSQETTPGIIGTNWHLWKKTWWMQEKEREREREKKNKNSGWCCFQRHVCCHCCQERGELTVLERKLIWGQGVVH